MGGRFTCWGAATPVGEGETTAAPPVHPSCALEAIEHCPHLRRHHAAALVERSALWGVAGILHAPVTLVPLPAPGGHPYDLVRVHVADPQIRWTLANFTVHSLDGVTAVSLPDLVVMAKEDLRHETADGSAMTAT
ncbi:hypothetical protein ACIQMR_36040 [Streptomyces sp. NPDC091376]|uniref:hypothetical protein n=1 Tax=Streptomyces sp. NPDC091376 TaxID=3365994 RepID=UPI00382C9A34